MPVPPLLSPLRANGNDVALVFLHGFGGDPAGTWGHFPDLLKAEPRLADWDLFSLGYTTRLVPDISGIWSANAPLDRLALLFHSTADQGLLRSYKSIAIVAHSMGGLIAQRALVDHEDLALKTSHVFLFGTPSAGLEKATGLSFFKRQVRDMAEGSPFVTDLRQRWNAAFGTPQFRFWTVAGDQDEFVPSSSSLDPFPLPVRCVVPGDHISIVKPSASTDLGVQIVINGLCGDAAPAGPGNAARVAVESREFARAIQLLMPHKNELDAQGLVQLALALEQTGRQQEAIALLEQNPETGTDPMGVLAGRLKRRWLLEHRLADATRAFALYQKAYGLATARGDHAQAYYHGINVAFMELAYRSDPAAAKVIALEVQQHCLAAPASLWRVATEGEASLLLGDVEASLAKYRDVIPMRPTARQVDSIFKQALRVADLSGDQKTLDRLSAIYRGEEAATA
jgi:hypothetical protein